MINKSTSKKLKSCDHFAAQYFAKYVSREMSEQDTALFLCHAETCSSCLQGVREATIVWQRQKDKVENDVLHGSALSIMDRLDQSIFSIVVSAFRGVVDLVRSTGEQMSMVPAFAGVRTSQNAAAMVQPLRIVKEIEESKISVEVTISPFEPDKLDVVVSLLDLQLEEFISGVTVSCSGESEFDDEITDENGQACFKLPAKGFHELVMKKNEQFLGDMTLTGL